MANDNLLGDMHTEDKAKLKMLLRSFATADDLKDFIMASKNTTIEQDRRKWAWNIIKKAAVAIVLFTGAFTAVKNGVGAGTWPWLK